MDIPRMLNCLIWDGTFHGRFADRQYAIDIYQRHNAEVMQTIPAERLLVYNVRDGWEPLCRFLGVPVPAGKPFPHLNSHTDYWRMVRLLHGAMLGGTILAGLAAWKIWLEVRKKHS